MGRKKLTQTKKVFNWIKKTYRKLTTSEVPEKKKIAVIHKLEIEDYKYLNRNLIKINKALFGIAVITLNKTERFNEQQYQIVITLENTK